MVAPANDPDDVDDPAWNSEGEDLFFLRDEGLELLALFKSIRDPDKRRLLLEIVRVVAGESPRR